MSQILGKCVGLVSGEDWRAIRAVVEVPFRHSNVVAHVDVIRRKVHDYVEELAREGDLRRGRLDPARDLKMLPFWVVAEIIYGRLEPAQIPELKDLAPHREALFRFVIRGGLSRFSLSKYLPTAANLALRNFRKRWWAFNRAAYSVAAARSDTGNVPPIVDMYRAVHEGTIAEEQLLQTLDESLYANLDVTTGGLS